MNPASMPPACMCDRCVLQRFVDAHDRRMIEAMADRIDRITMGAFKKQVAKLRAIKSMRKVTRRAPRS